MDARIVRVAIILIATLSSLGAGYRTQNFIVEAPTKELAEEIGRMAETYRHDLAVDWLGKPMPNWSQPCPITAQVAENLGAGGATSFLFDHGEVFGWKMNIQGSHERILDSVLPHEVTHTIFATHFRRPLPRWADEGACTTVEHESERSKQAIGLIQYLKTGRGIAFSQMFVMKEYPKDVLPLYAQGYSLARYLLDQGGKQKFLDYVAEGLQSENWPAITKKMYGFDNLGELQNSWLAWVKEGSPHLVPAGEQLASNTARSGRTDANPNYRAQSDDRGRRANPDGGRRVAGAPSPNQSVALSDVNSIHATDLKVPGTSIYERAMHGEPINLNEPGVNPEQPQSSPASNPPRNGNDGVQVAAQPKIILEWSRTAQR